MAWICARILAETPKQECISVWWSLIDRSVVAIKASLCLDHTGLAIIESYLIVMPFPTADEFPMLNGSLCTQVIQNIAKEPFLSLHGRGLLATQALHGPME